MLTAGGLDAVVTELNRHLARSGPRAGSVSVVAIDGPAGSGKTTLASRLRSAYAASAVVHMDDLYPGWDGLREGGAAVTAMLTAVSAGEPARYRRYDWEAGAYAETVAVSPAEVLLVEGVGSVRLEHAHLLSAVVWVEELDRAERLCRGLARDGDGAEGFWLTWMRQEQELFEEVGTRARADLLLDGQGVLVR